MRSSNRTTSRRNATLGIEVRQALVLALTVGVVGISFGATAAAAGIDPVKVCAMSMMVFAGGAQFAAVGVTAAGGSAIAAIVSALILNARYVPMGAALSPRLNHRRFAAAHLLIDESAAVALAEPDHASSRRRFWLTGLGIFVLWNAGTAVGAFTGAALGDPRALGLDAAIPGAMLALLAPQFDHRRGRAVAAAGALIAVALTPVLPAGVPILAASAAALVAFTIEETQT